MENNDQHTIQLEEADTKGRAYLTAEGSTLAEMTFSKAGAKLIIIDHTDVDESLRGTGVGRQLLDKVVAMAREQGKKILPLCPYARSVFDKDPSLQDIRN